MTVIQERGEHDGSPGARATGSLIRPGAPADELRSGEPDGLSLNRIHEYVWARYVEFAPPPCDLEEDQALAFLHEHYQRHPLAEDTECFYYGILAFERFFAGDCQEPSLRFTALRALSSYRGQTEQGFKWDAVEDRYQDLLDFR